MSLEYQLRLSPLKLYVKLSYIFVGKHFNTEKKKVKFFELFRCKSCDGAFL